MRPLFKLLDALLGLLWRTGCLAGGAVRQIGRPVASLLLGRPGSRRGETALGRLVRALGLAALGGFLAETWAGLADRLEDSAPARRWFFGVLALVLLLWISPPSHWGPWHRHQRGIASHYGLGFYFRRTANGELFYPGKVCAAHRTLPLGTTIKVVNRDNGRTLVVRVVDRGPFVEGRILDLSTAAGRRLGMVEPGTAEVDIYTRREIRPGGR